ncbi:hypothetical protein SYNPS1DRAFT_17312 [Syncephalis pseudoplumigaleata]|uniref:Ketoreductase domain-containing protein n=1 Tax=Syncephalis pseudoplumigaleata TaxID=1712513 RepID=A0A4P9YWX7_9FUNG|nr:hypothetical protein SYNPS1DRAFT_17312 [Syncephalis pseudoplumigaleata]|eukprot:RKP24368.1 hypothetical protein SYNPS1DRAFT_17312 [Syncephalis pseudoplumigaleata]
MSNYRFDNRVVLVTGAGGADAVVEEIVRAGGKAIANYDSVNDGERIVEAAVKAFGRVDIIINNAGILRDKSFNRMTDAEWDSVQEVHVRGSYKVTKAAWELMRKQKYGRIIMTASAAGIYGNFGQASYTKLSLASFSSTLAREGAKYNIHCNCIAPIAASRMTETVMPPEILKAVKPEYVTGLVSYLCHESTEENGGLFELGAGFVSKLRRERSAGVVFKADKTFTPGAIAAKWREINDFSQPQYPQNITDTNWIGLLEQANALSGNPKGDNLRYDGKVAIVTGAGGGLGRAYALLLSSLGASVVVNDLGGSAAGSGNDQRAADVVVEEIRRAGGKAVANYDSVEEGEKVVQTAIQAFGRVDILVNNAGILRDKSFLRMTDTDWDLVQRVHLRGTYKVTRAAWPYFVKQKYGRIVNTSSAVGLYGNFGQANYSAAKAGILALSNTLALEGRKNNIVVNTIAPNAGTRMTATIMPPEMVEALKPDYVAPLVAFLVHEACPDTGKVFEVGSGWVANVRWQRSGGYGFPVDRPLLPEDIAAKWQEIVDFDNGRATYPTNTQESFQGLYENYLRQQQKQQQAAPASSSSSGNGTSSVNEKAQQLALKPFDYTYTERDVILYALGVGCKRKELQFVYENASNFAPLPTFGVIPAFAGLNIIPYDELLPSFNPMLLLHGEQYLEIRGPLAPSGKLTQHVRVIDILDKGKSAVVVIGITSKDEQGREVFYNESTAFIRGSGGFGGPTKRTNPKPEAVAANVPPKRKPDAIITEKTTEEQAAIYRLSGDLNPLHIDPEMSAVGGFDVPILHGLCSFAIASKHVLQAFCHNDVSKFKAVKARFAKHVFPGETLETSMWREGSKVIFQTRVVERDAIAISNAAVQIADGPAKAKL